MTKRPSITNVNNKRMRSETSHKRMAEKRKIIAIGTSTGGPKALQVVLSQLPKSIDAPIVIVQHMPPAFTKSLANRLNALCEINVKEAEDGERLEKATAYIAPGGKHMAFDQSLTGELYVKLTEDPLVSGHRPSVDVMFASLSSILNLAKIAVVLTGMGADGSEGLAQLKQSGKVWAIAESEQSCIVYGMPKSAINTGLVDTVAELHDIGAAIMKYMK